MSSTENLAKRKVTGGKEDDSSLWNFMFIPVKIHLQTEVHELQALVDLGAEQSLIRSRSGLSIIHTHGII